MEQSQKKMPKTAKHNQKTESVHERASWSQGFHLTKFTPRTMRNLLLWFIVFYLYFSIMLGAISVVNKVTGLSIGKGTSTFISFVFVEVFPLALLASFFTHRRHWLLDWWKIFGRDIRKNWQAIVSWGMMLFVVQLGLNLGITKIIGNAHPLSSANTTSLLGDIRQNFLLVLMSMFIAPICEELIFRYFVTGLLHHTLSKHFRSHRADVFLYIMSATFSAFLFAILHDGLDWANIPVYMACGLFLQLVQERTQSLTAPALVHSFYNLLTILISLV